MSEGTASVTIPSPFSSESQVREQVEKWQDRYMACVEEARKCASLTADSEFQRIVNEFRLRVANCKRDITARLKQYAEISEASGLVESDEKALKEIAKDSSELRARHSAFENDTISPIRKKANAPAEMLESFRSQAVSRDGDFPLGLTVKFVDALKAAKAAWPSVVWNAELTKVTVVEAVPPTQAEAK